MKTLKNRLFTSENGIRIKKTRFPVSVFWTCIGICTVMSGVHQGVIVAMDKLKLSGILQTHLLLLFWVLVAAGMALYIRRKMKITYELPLQRISKAIRKVAKGDFSVDIPTTNAPDKLDYLDLMILDLNRMIKELGSIETLKTDFISNVSHEIKTPLAIISANTEVLEMVSEPNEWTVSIKNQITRLNGLLKELLSLAKMEEEKPALTMADFNISDAVYDAASPFTTLAETKGKKLTIDVANGLSYHGDEGAIRQLVSILTENAVKYADEGGEIAVKLFTSHNGKETDLEVSNTCKEPPQGDLTKLFDRFYRDDSSRSRSKGEKKGGYGIGLSIAQAIVRSHKSKISCKAENGMMIFTAQLK